MTLSSSRANRPGDLSREWIASAISSALLLSVTAAVLFVALRSPLKDDIAWLLYVARRWLNGRELYIDLVEVNPPLIIWISAVPLQLARWLDADPQFVVMPVFVAAVLACSSWAGWLLRMRGGLFARVLPVCAAVGTTLLIVPAADLGQREHLLVAAFLPYLVLFTRSLEGKRTHLLVSLAAGLLAGLGCALKPRYAGVFVALECVALTRGLRPWRSVAGWYRSAHAPGGAVRAADGSGWSPRSGGRGMVGGRGSAYSA